MKSTVNFLSPGEAQSESLELAATTAQLAIIVGGKNTCRIVDERERSVSDYVVVPTYPIAEGIAMNWWWFVAGRSGMLALQRFRDGFALPNIWFRPDGRTVGIDCYPFSFNNPPLSFYEEAHEEVCLDDFKVSVQILIENALRRLDDTGVRNTRLQERWNDIQHSLNDDEEKLFCEVAGSLRIDPYLCTDFEADIVDRAISAFTADGAKEFLASQQANFAKASLEWLKKQQAALANTNVLVNLSSLREFVDKDLSKVNADWSRPWKVGKAAAIALRQEMSLPAATTFQDTSRVASLFGGESFEIAKGRAHGIRSSVLSSKGIPSVIVGEFSKMETRMFALARAIGDYLVFGPDEEGFPITNATSFRQAVGRAFAAEMLAPSERVLEMFDSNWDIEEIAETQFVEPEVVRNQLRNEDRLPREYVVPEMGRQLFQKVFAA